MGWEPWVIVLTAFVVVGGVMRGWTWWQRERVIRALSDKGFVRTTRGVTLRVMVRGTEVLPGMRSGRTHRTRGDLVLLEDRFVITSSRGTLIDVGEGHGLRFTSARSTGPGKLVIEGQVPRSDGHPGLYRIEAFLPEALAWVDALQAWVQPDDGAPRFATRSPWSEPSG